MPNIQLPVLRRGSGKTEYVIIWQTFLHSQGLYNSTIEGDFADLTHAATVIFERKYGLVDDGIVDEETWGMALARGLRLNTQQHLEIYADPRPPINFTFITKDKKSELFGSFSWDPSPTKSNPEAIVISSGWIKANVVKLHIPQLKELSKMAIGCGFPSGGYVLWHEDYAQNLIEFFREVDNQGLLGRVMSWGGAWAPRLVRGGKTLSNHAFATAFDINVPWNGLGCKPTARGKLGSVAELVPIALDHGFWWGGWGWGKGTRLDGMHFEIGKWK